ncbi:helix-turn-helix domain-containing protein [uncultured Cohaesibacter sp.]|uniref:helix-turn-helix domain-containing protein n=1 Tax=uncultured Cohaesibacter sp. TaxID=1002546 RepID=UPI0029C964B6|nr:helix-turn-helix domain-containing protein [uncultured Cohaesibacter sp.]
MDEPDEDIFISEFPDESSIETAKKFLSLIPPETEKMPEISLAVIRDDGGKEELALSAATQQAIIDMFRLIADGKRFQINSVEIELTVEQAAEILRFSTNHMKQLVRDGRIPSLERDGQKILHKSVILAFQEERRRKMTEGMEMMTAMDADMLDAE